MPLRPARLCAQQNPFLRLENIPVRYQNTK